MLTLTIHDLRFTIYDDVMTPEQWQKVEDVLQGALDCAPRDRASFLEEACAGDEQLKEEATSLVDAYDEAGDFIEQPAIARDARVLVGDEVGSKVGCEIGPYRIVKRLGSGGMGEVYLAQDARLDRLVALKILPAYFAADDARLRRFQREARAVSALNHPNILTIHEVGESAGIPYISTEFIDGVTIRELVNGETLPLDAVLDIAEQVTSALSAAHAAGIVHRDIKPENIMRRDDGLVKILDFGIAKLMESETLDNFTETQPGARDHTEAGLVMGTVNYMSPEQARGLPVDERTDIWSLGVVLYEMLARRRPFSAATRIDTMVGILEREPKLLTEVVDDEYRASAPLQQIVNKCLSKQNADRYRTASELLAELKDARKSLHPGAKSSQPAIQVPANRPAAGSLRRYAWPIACALVLLIAALAVSNYYWRLGQATQGGATTAKLYSQMSESEQLEFVDKQEQRISTMMGDGPVKLNDDALRVIKAYVDHYAAEAGASGLDSDKIGDVCERARPYIPLIASSFSARKVPVIIGIYLPVIESAYRNCYENSIGAKGLFQFLPGTAESYGVARQDMCDVEKMTPAAAHYLADRMAELGEDSQSVTLVLLSYNRGPEWVRNTLRELRGTENYERNFWTLFAHRETLDETFRNENAGYVPRFFAAAIIGENPETFALSTPPLSSLAGKAVGSRQ